jgi:hypothetical protein
MAVGLPSQLVSNTQACECSTWVVAREGTATFVQPWLVRKDLLQVSDAVLSVASSLTSHKL